uniref:F-box domain-containing protein n=1 Tax=Oryza punctata TaxID=4537 RepID=A0A0E0MGJ1_ORYPU
MEGNSPELPQDVLMEIFALLEVPDLVRAGSVCSSWRASYISLCKLGGYKQAQTPCLLYTSESAGENVACLYSLAEKRAYKLTMPDPPIRSRYIIGSSYGWIITADERSELHLVNPITGDQINLPTVTTIEQVKPICDDAGVVHAYEYSWYTGGGHYCPSPSTYSLGLLRKYLFWKAFLSSDPSMGDYFVVLIHNPQAQLSFARAGSDKWTWLPPHADYMDCLFEDGLLYALNSLGEVHAFDLSAPTVTQKSVVGEAKTYIRENMYFARTPCGDLLQIWRSLTTNTDDCVDQMDGDVLQFDLDEYEDDLEQGSEHVKWSAGGDGLKPKSDEDEDDDNLEPDPNTDSLESYTNMIEVFKVDFCAKMLVDISSLGNSVLFLGHNQTLCLNADAYPQLKSNHIYFTDDYSLYLFGWKKNHRDTGVLNLENDSVEPIVSPELWSNWPVPVWVIPNPRKMISASHD